MGRTELSRLGDSDGNADSVTIIDLANDPAWAVQHVTVGDAPEGFAISPLATWRL